MDGVDVRDRVERAEQQPFGDDRVIRPMHVARLAAGLSSAGGLQYRRRMDCRTRAIWDERFLAYDFGEHPMHPVRLDLTVRLARELGVLERLELAAPAPATEQQLLSIHTADYLQAVRAASEDATFTGYGLGTTDDPVFAGMYDAAALVGGCFGAGGAGDVARRGRPRRQHRRRAAPCDARPRVGVLHLQRRGARDPRVARGRGAEGRLPRHRRPPRRRRAGRLLRRPAGADDQPAPGPPHALPRHRHGRRDRVRRRGGDVDQRAVAAGHRRRRLAARLRRCRARGGARVQTRCRGLAVRLRHPPRGPAGQPGADDRRPAGGDPADARAWRTRSRAGSGSRSAAAATG